MQRVSDNATRHDQLVIVLEAQNRGHQAIITMITDENPQFPTPAAQKRSTPILSAIQSPKELKLTIHHLGKMMTKRITPVKRCHY